jgi:predicted nucleic acid-binding protein
LANEPVLVDTSCWIEYFNRPGAEVATAVEAMVRGDRAALTGIVLAELLQGVRTERESSELHTALGAVHWIEDTRETYARACVIAAASENVDGRVLTLDAHFQEIAGITSLTVLPER